MTKPNKAETPMESLLSAAAPGIGAQARAFWNAQAAAAGHMQAFLDEWYDRRREASEAAAACCSEVFEHGADPAAATEAWRKWSTGAFERLGADAADQTALVAQLAGDAAGAFSAGVNGAAPVKHGRHGKSATKSADGGSQRQDTAGAAAS